MKNIVDNLFMGRMHKESDVDNESIRCFVPFYVGSNPEMSKCIYVKGTLNVVENIFHWNNEDEVGAYLEGFETSIEEAVEQR